MATSSSILIGIIVGVKVVRTYTSFRGLYLPCDNTMRADELGDEIGINS